MCLIDKSESLCVISHSMLTHTCFPVDMKGPRWPFMRKATMESSSQAALSTLTWGPISTEKCPLKTVSKSSEGTLLTLRCSMTPRHVRNGRIARPFLTCLSQRHKPNALPGVRLQNLGSKYILGPCTWLCYKWFYQHFAHPKPVFSAKQNKCGWEVAAQ